MDKIFSISNYIYNQTKGIIDYTSIKAILNYHIGFRITITQEEFNSLNQKVIYLRNLTKQIENIMGYIKTISTEECIIFINNNETLFDSFLESFNNVFDDIKNDILTLRNKSFSINLNQAEPENHKEGTEWINTLFDFYLKYNGKRLVSAIEFFYHIRKVWSSIEDNDTFIISHITDNILGGISLLNISVNLREWILKNGDVIRHKDIIDVSLDIKQKKILYEDYIMV